MERVKVDFTHCYGIKALVHEFDFRKKRAWAIYAANGVMKTSFARIFRNIAEGEKPSDRIFPDRESKWKSTDESGLDLKPEQIFVVSTYDEKLGHSEKTSTLLVNSKLREEYENLHIEVNQCQESLLTAIKKHAGSNADFEKEITSTFSPGEDDLYKALRRIKSDLDDLKETPFADIPYDQIFDERIIAALEKKNLKSLIEEYVERYNELLEASNFFKRGTFDYYNAGQVAKSLTDNGFFSAQHTVTLISDGERREITNQKELEEVIEFEKEAILKDENLRNRFEEIAKILDKNVTLRNFRKYVQQNEAVLAQLNNLDKFKNNILLSYLKVNHDLYQDFMAKYEKTRSQKEAIEKAAAEERTQWEAVIEMFNKRFVVPFTLEAKNKIAVRVGHAKMIELGFTYHDGSDHVSIDKESLLQSLSTGEKKAFYLLNVLFEIETRRLSRQETLVVIDDIADSFDYQNKYAIIQYLKEHSEDGLFKQIIMTHNFDFFRTIESRFVTYPFCLAAQKTPEGIVLKQATEIKNVFVRDWKKNFFSDPKKKIACIPFLRNLVEFTSGEDDPNFLKLTSLLHWKPDSAAITVGNLDAIYNDICKATGGSPNPTDLVCDVLDEQARECLGVTNGLNLENKIVLAIAARISAERLMIAKINDAEFVSNIESHQTQALSDRFKKEFANETEIIGILDRVTLMTPENIHLNSFMYEPIIDLSDNHLKQLYSDLTALT